MDPHDRSRAPAGGSTCGLHPGCLGFAHLLGAPVRTRGNAPTPRESAADQAAARRAGGFHPLGAHGAARSHMARDVQQRPANSRRHVLHRPNQRSRGGHADEHGLSDGNQVPHGDGGRDVRHRHVHHRVHLSFQGRIGPELRAGRRGVRRMAGRRRVARRQLQSERQDAVPGRRGVACPSESSRGGRGQGSRLGKRLVRRAGAAGEG